jgi:hypothetical protein
MIAHTHTHMCMCQHPHLWVCGRRKGACPCRREEEREEEREGESTRRNHHGEAMVHACGCRGAVRVGGSTARAEMPTVSGETHATRCHGFKVVDAAVHIVVTTFHGHP